MKNKGSFRTLATAMALLGTYFFIQTFEGNGTLPHLCVLCGIPFFWVYLNRLVSTSAPAVLTCIWFTPAFLLFGFELCGISFHIDTSFITNLLYHAAAIVESLALILYGIYMGSRTGLSASSILDYLFHDGKLHIAHIQYLHISAGSVALAGLNAVLLFELSSSENTLMVASGIAYIVFFILLVGIVRVGFFSEMEAMSRRDQMDFFMRTKSREPEKPRQKSAPVPAQKPKEFWQRKPAEPGSLQEAFEELLIHQEYYLKPGITLIEMAQELKSNKTYLSKMVNTTYEMSFSDLLNGLRIEYAKKYLLNNRSAKQEVIALACGFPTASAFNYSFKKEVGVTPKIWLVTQTGND